MPQCSSPPPKKKEKKKEKEKTKEKGGEGKVTAVVSFFFCALQDSISLLLGYKTEVTAHFPKIILFKDHKPKVEKKKSNRESGLQEILWE